VEMLYAPSGVICSCRNRPLLQGAANTPDRTKKREAERDLPLLPRSQRSAVVEQPLELVVLASEAATVILGACKRSWWSTRATAAADAVLQTANSRSGGVDASRRDVRPGSCSSQVSTPT